MTALPPDWLDRIAAVGGRARVGDLSRFAPPPDGGRASAVLILFSQGDDQMGEGPDVLLTQRADGMRSHPGQVSFPGGSLEPGDGGPVGAALRESQEETGLDPSGVDVLGTLPSLFLPPSGYVVTPVLARWRVPSPVAVMDEAEVARVVRAPLDELLDPANRFTTMHPSGTRGPAFRVRGLFVWGFTAGLLSRLLSLSGLERPWDTSRLEDLPTDLAGRR